MGCEACDDLYSSEASFCFWVVVFFVKMSKIFLAILSLGTFNLTVCTNLIKLEVSPPATGS